MALPISPTKGMDKPHGMDVVDLEARLSSDELKQFDLSWRRARVLQDKDTREAHVSEGSDSCSTKDLLLFPHLQTQPED
eukprot:CAMPEP_0197497984 /NCGR_PEP_ID=MMETSP1311-20131121/54835_1 /TAXON_ID=464262 /ORGANISM="Genus nov. species nov., Strain RCC856" /LENGTH=78 /DNA_ID=CAMNT_0043043681 /DNA_START=65 /DNA_END=301 /DNA_ORIENTATION=-